MNVPSVSISRTARKEQNCTSHQKHWENLHLLTDYCNWNSIRCRPLSVWVAASHCLMEVGHSIEAHQKQYIIIIIILVQFSSETRLYNCYWYIFQNKAKLSVSRIWWPLRGEDSNKKTLVQSGMTKKVAAVTWWRSLLNRGVIFLSFLHIISGLYGRSTVWPRSRFSHTNRPSSVNKS